ncbi:MAG: DNA gyrase inhibitor YacG [Pseudolabrys sp.]|nr:DNA gyrase inhibitor YacG [Pseudolabrys sp.]MBV9261434.1 DNA gyrase inhibitor YacG [Pseudolabrys sp.]
MPPLAPAKPCPICGKPAEEQFKPFCSSRCRDVDLNRWFSGVYSVPVAEDEDEDGDAAIKSETKSEDHE